MARNEKEKENEMNKVSCFHTHKKETTALQGASSIPSQKLLLLVLSLPNCQLVQSKSR